MGLTRKELINKQKLHNDSKGLALTKHEQDALNDVSKQQNDPDWRGQLSPFRVDINPQGVNDGTKTVNSFGLNQYQWYPEGTALKYNDDYYTNYIPTETDGGLFTGTSLSDLTSDGGIGGVLNKTGEYASQQLGGVTKSIKGLFGGDDGDEEKKGGVPLKTTTPFDDFINESPHVILYEFQPNSAISELTGMFKAVFASFDQMFDKENKGKSSLMDNIGRLFSKDGLNDILKTIMPNASTNLNTAHGKIVDIPNYFYTNLIGGYYSGQYTLPFFGQSGFLHGMGDAGWEAKSMKQRMLGGMSGMLDNISEAASAFDIAGKPKWTMSGSGPAGDEVTFEMTLFNSTDSVTIKNIQMLNALVSGNMWTQNIFLQLSPCLYDIEVVGRYRFYFCKADIKVEFVGKQRRPYDGFVQQLSIDPNKPIGNPNAYKYIPDAYKLTIKFVSLIPNNFNMYLNYLLVDTNKIEVGNSRSSTGSTMLGAIKDSLTLTKQELEALNTQSNDATLEKK